MKSKPDTLSPHHSTSILVGKAYRAVYKGVRTALSQQKLPPAQLILLAALWEKDGQSGAELGVTLGLDSASMTGLLDRSVAKGYVERRPEPNDRRINRIWLTDSGRALEASVTGIMLAFDDNLATLVEGDIDAFNRSLARLGDIHLEQE